MIYLVRHNTRFRYKPAVRESITEVRMHPRTEGNQRCLSFDLRVKPDAVIMQYRDFLGNLVHHFDIAGKHSELGIKAQSVVEVLPGLDLQSRGAGTWEQLESAIEASHYWEMLLPSEFARRSPLLDDLAREMCLERQNSPLETLMFINHGIHKAFAYVPNSTNVDSPIDHALAERQGVCQDFAHVMIAVVRKLSMPCRYVSGYLFHANSDRSCAAEGASHAWVEALLPGMGWTGFDPTNDMPCGERHIRVAVGRDYAEVPPTRGVYKGGGESELSVSVTVNLADAPTVEEAAPSMVLRRAPPPLVDNYLAEQEQQQQQ
jgi:transglutaminase-like putative cysteine protease